MLTSASANMFARPSTSPKGEGTIVPTAASSYGICAEITANAGQKRAGKYTRLGPRAVRPNSTRSGRLHLVDNSALQSGGASKNKTTLDIADLRCVTWMSQERHFFPFVASCFPSVVVCSRAGPGCVFGSAGFVGTATRSQKVDVVSSRFSIYMTRTRSFAARARKMRRMGQLATIDTNLAQQNSWQPPLAPEIQSSTQPQLRMSWSLDADEHGRKRLRATWRRIDRPVVSRMGQSVSLDAFAGSGGRGLSEPMSHNFADKE